MFTKQQQKNGDINTRPSSNYRSKNGKLRRYPSIFQNIRCAVAKNQMVFRCILFDVQAYVVKYHSAIVSDSYTDWSILINAGDD